MGDLVVFVPKDKKKKSDPTHVPIDFFEHKILAPYDETTGSPSGKKQHYSLDVTKEWGPGSTYLMEALVKSSELEMVVLHVPVTPSGAHMTMTLKHAKVVKLDVFNDSGVQKEKISFIYKIITVADTTSSRESSDKWIAA